MRTGLTDPPPMSSSFPPPLPPPLKRPRPAHWLARPEAPRTAGVDGLMRALRLEESGARSCREFLTRCNARFDREERKARELEERLRAAAQDIERREDELEGATRRMAACARERDEARRAADEARDIRAENARLRAELSGLKQTVQATVPGIRSGLGRLAEENVGLRSALETRRGQIGFLERMSEVDRRRLGAAREDASRWFWRATEGPGSDVE